MGRGYSGALQARGGLEEPLERGLRGQRSDMQKVTLGLLVFLAGFPVLDANDLEDKNSPFYYDWHSLQVGGLICAGVLCAMGIIIVMSAKCKCKFGQKSGHHPGETPPLITPGSAQS
ncbi:FXYD domain-containing ion transport regulator 3 isoform 7 precursor [Homo sapiens]|uniref:FXYD domain-containing ion transport regulator n=1 Tax=Homo sapiens TaxID=9606 RepID=A0A1S5UZ23_HUMAN|nr:FXYD domain-containing ion transport regulator 3 isoform 7 [Homo sapiens]AQN67652.1 FXYD domain-containing ion transport regulator 3 [Homo sapiens]